jgi:hypothetical protein
MAAAVRSMRPDAHWSCRSGRDARELASMSGNRSFGHEPVAFRHVKRSVEKGLSSRRWASAAAGIPELSENTRGHHRSLKVV